MTGGGGPGGVATGPGGGPPAGDDEEAARAYLDHVRRDIEEEVRRRAASDLPPAVERELDELFMRHAPHGNRGAGLRDMLRQVDAAVFIDPMVPIASRRPGGAAVKRGLRSLSLWYLRYVTYQVSAFATAVSRALHVLDLQMSDLRRQMEAAAPPPSVVVDTAHHRPDAWWVPGAVDAVAPTGGRVLHAACGGGWLVGALGAAGVDAYGVDPRPGAVLDHELDDLDLREEELGAHLDAVAPGSLSAVVLSGVVEGAAHAERLRLVEGTVRALGPGGVLVVHSLARATWDGDDAPLEADLVPARPYRPATWQHVLGDMGLEADWRQAPDGGDYVVTARRRAAPA